MPSSTHLSRLSLSLAVSMLMLTACTSTPSSKTLLTGIDSSALAKSADASQAPIVRTATDPVCTQFYANAVDFSKQAAQPNRGGQILAATGLSVLAAVATYGLFSGIGSATGQIAAQTATNQLIYTGGNAALSGLNSNNGPDKKIIQAAESLGCPVSTI